MKGKVILGCLVLIAFVALPMTAAADMETISYTATHAGESAPQEMVSFAGDLVGSFDHSGHGSTTNQPLRYFAFVDTIINDPVNDVYVVTTNLREFVYAANTSAAFGVSMLFNLEEAYSNSTIPEDVSQLVLIGANDPKWLFEDTPLEVDPYATYPDGYGFIPPGGSITLHWTMEVGNGPAIPEIPAGALVPIGAVLLGSVLFLRRKKEVLV